MDGEYRKCVCTAQGQVECQCIEQEDNCGQGQEKYFDEDCKLQCARGMKIIKFNMFTDYLTA